MAALLVGAEWVLPGWMGEFREGLAAYQRYTGGAQSMLEVLTTPWAGKVLSVALLAWAAWVCWRARQARAESREFVLATSLLLAVTVVTLPKLAPYNQALLLPAIFLLVKDWRSWSGQGRAARMLGWIAAAALFWPWIAAAGMSMGLLFVPAMMVQRAWAVPLYTSVWLPLAVVMLLGLEVRFRPASNPAIPAKA
jgi:hypothetical protein